MNLKEYYDTIEEEEQNLIDDVYMNLFIEEMPREKFDEFDEETFFAMIKKQNDSNRKIIRLVKTYYIFSLICIVSAVAFGFYLGKVF